MESCYTYPKSDYLFSDSFSRKLKFSQKKLTWTFLKGTQVIVENWLNLYLASGLNHVRVLKALEDQREVWPSKVGESGMVVQHAGHPPGTALGLGEAH